MSTSTCSSDDGRAPLNIGNMTSDSRATAGDATLTTTRTDEEATSSASTSYMNMMMTDDHSSRNHNHSRSIPIYAFLIAFLSTSPFLVWTAFKLGVVPIGLYFTIHMMTAPLAIQLRDKSGWIRWLAGFVCLILLSGIKTVLFLTRFSNGGEGDENENNDGDNRNPLPFDRVWLYAFTALWECSNALAVFGGRSLLERYGITTHSRALLAALCPVQVKFLEGGDDDDDDDENQDYSREHGQGHGFLQSIMMKRIKWNTLHLIMYLIIYILCRVTFRQIVDVMESFPILEAEGLVILLSCIVHVWNVPAYMFQLCLFFLLPLFGATHVQVQVIYPYGAIYTSTSTRQFWSRWSRPASSVLRHIFYYPLGGKDRAWLSIPIMFLLNASSHYDVSNALVGDRAEVGWNVVFGVLGFVATLEVLGDGYFHFARNENGNDDSLPQATVPGWYRVVRFVLAAASLRVAAYVLVHRCLHLSISSMLGL